VGFVLPQFLVTADEAVDPEIVHNETWWFMLYTSIGINVVFLLTIFLVSDGPGGLTRRKGKNMAKHERLMDQELTDSGVQQDEDLAQDVGAQIKGLFKRPVFN